MPQKTKQKYLFFARAKWEKGWDSPGGKEDSYKTESRTFFKKFRASNEESARLEAKRLLQNFKSSLPEAHQSSMSWQDEPKILTAFAMILEP